MNLLCDNRFNYMFGALRVYKAMNSRLIKMVLIILFAFFTPLRLLFSSSPLGNNFYCRSFSHPLDVIETAFARRLIAVTFYQRNLSLARL